MPVLGVGIISSHVACFNGMCPSQHVGQMREANAELLFVPSLVRISPLRSGKMGGSGSSVEGIALARFRSFLVDIGVLSCYILPRMVTAIINWVLNHIWEIALGSVIGLGLGTVNYFVGDFIVARSATWPTIGVTGMKTIVELIAATNKILDVVGYVGFYASVFSLAGIVARRIRDDKWF